jgi:hypothetical protein
MIPFACLPAQLTLLIPHPNLLRLPPPKHMWPILYFRFPSSACSKDPGLLESVVAGLTDLLRSGDDSAGQASARAIKNLSAGHTNSNKVCALCRC